METYISKALAGDHEAFARLYDAYAPEALRLSTAVTGRADLAADAVQEAFLRVYRKGYQCRGEFKPWFFRIVLNESYRMAGQNPYPSESTDEDSAPNFSEQSDLAMTVHAALDHLSPEHRAVLVLKYLFDYTERDIAKILDIRTGTVKSRIFYARKALAKELNREELPL